MLIEPRQAVTSSPAVPFAINHGKRKNRGELMCGVSGISVLLVEIPPEAKELTATRTPEVMNL